MGAPAGWYVGAVVMIDVCRGGGRKEPCRGRVDQGVQDTLRSRVTPLPPQSPTSRRGTKIPWRRRLSRSRQLLHQQSRIQSQMDECSRSGQRSPYSVGALVIGCIRGSLAHLDEVADPLRAIGNAILDSSCFQAVDFCYTWSDSFGLGESHEVPTSCAYSWCSLLFRCGSS